jgi:hypothetical protein
MIPPNETPEQQSATQAKHTIEKLNAYRRQHAALRSHMLWLEGEIRQLEQAVVPADPEPNTDVADDSATLASNPVPLNTEVIEPLVSSAPAASDLGRIRLGCGLFAILAAALFLYLLFGLPYRIYN